MAFVLGGFGSSCSSPSDDGPIGAAGAAGAASGGGGSGAAGGSSGAGNGGAGAGTGGQSGSGGSPAAGGSGAGSAGAPGSGGGGASGAGGSGGAGLTSALCPEGALFCDSFEDDSVAQAPGAPWRASLSGGATANVDEAQAFSGTKAVHVNAPVGAANRRGYIALDQGSAANIFPAAATNMFGRAMMYLQTIPNADAHWTFIQGEGRSADDRYNALYRYGGQHQNGAQFMANYETTDNIGTDCYDHSASTMPAAAWTCVEWHFVVATNEMQFWLNGAELTDLHVIDRGEGCGGTGLGGQWLAPPAFQTLYLGWEHYQAPANDINLWLDDVVVDTERVGCPAPQ